MRSMTSCLLALGLLVLVPASSALADGAAVDAATADQKQSAQKHFETAIKSFQDSKLDAALAEFSASYGVVASPNAHYMMAKCLDGLGKPADAYNALASVEKDARGLEKYTETLKNSADLRSEVAKKVGLVVVNVSGRPAGAVSATVGRDTVPIGVQYAVMPGKVEAAVLVDGKVAKNDGAAVNAGETHAFTFDLTPAPAAHPEPAKPVTPGVPPATSEPMSSGSGSGRVGFYVGGGVSAAVAVAGFGVAIPFGIKYKNDKDAFLAKCKGNVCNNPNLKQDGDNVQKEGNIATAGFVVGGVAAALSVTLFAVGATRSKGSSSDQSSIEVDLGPASVGVSGAF